MIDKNCCNSNVFITKRIYYEIVAIYKKDKKNQSYYLMCMNKIINTFLLVGDKFLSDFHLENTIFTYSAG